MLWWWSDDRMPAGNRPRTVTRKTRVCDSRTADAKAGIFLGLAYGSDTLSSLHTVWSNTNYNSDVTYLVSRLLNRCDAVRSACVYNYYQMGVWGRVCVLCIMDARVNRICKQICKQTIYPLTQTDDGFISILEPRWPRDQFFSIIKHYYIQRYCIFLHSCILQIVDSNKTKSFVAYCTYSEMQLFILPQSNSLFKCFIIVHIHIYELKCR